MAGRDGTDPEGERLPSRPQRDGIRLGRRRARRDLGPGDLEPDEERLLAALERDARGLADGLGGRSHRRRGGPPTTRRR